MDYAAFSDACQNLGTSNHSQAESYLISLRSSPTAVDLALHVLNQPQKELVLFHAALLLRDAALRQYDALGLEKSSRLLQTCLDIALTKSLTVSTDTLLQTTGALFKRSYLEASVEMKKQLILRSTELLQVNQLEMHADRLLLHLIWEFSLGSHASNLGQSLEFHSKCARHFTKDFLKDIFILLASHLTRTQSQDSCACILEILDTILTWPFDQYRVEESSNGQQQQYSAPLDYRSGTHQIRNSSRRIAPGRSWSFLVNNTATSFLVTLMNIYQAGASSTLIKTRIRQILISLSCLSGDVFESDEIRILHSNSISNIGYSFCQNALTKKDILKNEINFEEQDSPLASELADGCILISRSLSIPPLDLILKDDSLFPNLLGLTLAISTTCRECSIPYVNTYLGESLRNILCVWVLWISHFASSKNTIPKIQSSLLNCTASIFESLVSTQIFTAHLNKDMEDDGDDDENENNEEMSDLACIARANPSSSLQSLCSFLSNVDSYKIESNETRAEIIGFLFELTVDVLADPDDGETPIIPRTIMACSHSYNQEQQQDVVVVTSKLLLEIFERETNRNSYQLTPFLSKTMISSLRRWAASFLFPSSSLYAKKSTSGSEDDDGYHSGTYGSSLVMSESIKANFGSSENGMIIFNFLIEQSCVHLFKYGAEKDVGESIVHLFETLFRNKSKMIASTPWQKVGQANIESIRNENWSPFTTLSSEIHGDLNRVLVSSFPENDMYGVTCFDLMIQRLRGLLQNSQNFHPTWISNSLRLIELFHGMGKCTYTVGFFHTKIREKMIGSLPDLVSLLELSKNNNSARDPILLGVLSVFTEFCEYQLSFTESAFIPIVFSQSKRLVDLFSMIENENKLKRKMPEHGEELEFRASTLNKILRLLISLSERNAIDFSSDEVVQSEQYDASGVVLSSIDAVLSLFDTDIFQIEEVVDSYFDLVSGMCRTRPEYVCNLSPSLFRSVLQSLTFGCEYHNPKIQRWCFESAGALIKLHADTSALGPQIQQQPGNFFFDFMLKLFKITVLTADSSAIESASIVLLNFARCDGLVFKQASEQLLLDLSNMRRTDVNEQSENNRIVTLVSVIERKFQKLFEGVRIEGGDRTDRKKFANNLQSFVNEVRAFVFLK